MSASKRKFNTLINNLGNRSTTSLASQASSNASASLPDLTLGANSNALDDADSLSKKRRVNQLALDSSTRTLSRPRSFLGASSAADVNRRANTGVIKLTAAPADEPPKYAPWDRAAFLQRLKTFSNITDWTPKPAPVNEVEWAKRGWVCQKKERVRCCFCSVEILVGLNKREKDGEVSNVYVATEIEQALVERYAELIITSHRDDCPWRSRGCDETIFKLPLSHPASTFKSIRERYDELLSMKDNLPYMRDLKLPPELDLKTVLRHLPQDVFGKDVDQVNQVAFAMALFGWQSKPGRPIASGAAGCAVCFRTLGLWMFRSKEVSATGEVIQPATIDHLDPVEEHREYCPWRSAEAQSGASAEKPLAAWQVVLRVINNDWILRNPGGRTPSKSGRVSSTTAERASEDTTGATDPSTVTTGDGKKEKRKSFPNFGTLMHRRTKSNISTAETTASTAADSTISESVLENEDDGEGADDDEAAKKAKEQKDKERWARLRRVKSLFDAKGKGKPKLKKVTTAESTGTTGSAIE